MRKRRLPSQVPRPEKTPAVLASGRLLRQPPSHSQRTRDGSRRRPRRSRLARTRRREPGHPGRIRHPPDRERQRLVGGLFRFARPASMPRNKRTLSRAKTLRRYYEALHGKDTSTTPRRGVFRADPRLLLLLTRLQWEPNGDPHVPGNLDTWKRILHQKSESNVVRYWARKAKTFRHAAAIAGSDVRIVSGAARSRPAAGLLVDQRSRQLRAPESSPQSPTPSLCWPRNFPNSAINT